MGQHAVRASIIIALLVVTGILIHRAQGSTAIQRSQPLRRVIDKVEGWRSVGEIPLDSAVIQSLDLDDYLNHAYTDGTKTVALYVGFYSTSRKIGAAHDPLVCFSGQGWTVSGHKQGELSLTDSPTTTISFTEMTAERRQEKQLIAYWFQAYDRSTPDTFSQKVSSAWQRLAKGRGENAFVRLSMPIGSASEEECRETIHRFMRAFYPVFMSFVQG